ncbi:MAG: hypothetical protein KHZ89_08740, partial [Lachnospiraceae bacterium]|nr:hypothetical protein [Lachnospiraceae bacterium]
HTEQGVFGTLLPYMCPQQYSTILASLFQTEVFAQWDESERLHTSFDLMHVNEKINSGSVDSVPFLLPSGILYLNVEFVPRQSLLSWIM